MAGKKVTDQVPWTEMSFMRSHVCRRGDLNPHGIAPTSTSISCHSFGLTRSGEFGQVRTVPDRYSCGLERA